MSPGDRNGATVRQTAVSSPWWNSQNGQKCQDKNRPSGTKAISERGIAIVIITIKIHFKACYFSQDTWKNTHHSDLYCEILRRENVIRLGLWQSVDLILIKDESGITWYFKGW